VDLHGWLAWAHEEVAAPWQRKQDEMKRKPVPVP
jgi:hypothetical protein